MIELETTSGKRVRVRPGLVAAIKELAPTEIHPEPATRVQVGLRGHYVVRGDYDRVCEALQAHVSDKPITLGLTSAEWDSLAFLLAGMTASDAEAAKMAIHRDTIGDMANLRAILDLLKRVQRGRRPKDWPEEVDW